ncbi:hypothetical protein [Streptomyces sp. NPDC059787]
MLETEPYCDDCADYGCPGHWSCDQCQDDICNDCNGCACPQTPCPGNHH